jgi:hypothetical protein
MVTPTYPIQQQQTLRHKNWATLTHTKALAKAMEGGRHYSQAPVLRAWGTCIRKDLQHAYVQLFH